MSVAPGSIVSLKGDRHPNREWRVQHVSNAHGRLEALIRSTAEQWGTASKVVPVADLMPVAVDLEELPA